MIRWKLADNVATERAGEELLLLELASGEAYRLNKTGRLMLEKLLENGELAWVVRELATVFRIDATRLEQDVQNLQQELLRRGLLRAR